MDYSRFLEILLSEGRGVVPTVGPIEEPSRQQGAEVLAKYELVWRRNLPRPVPQFQADAANWAGENLFRACQFSVFRDADESIMRTALQTPCPVASSPEVHYSVDLTYRFLPDIAKSVRTAAAKDPLLDVLTGWGQAWPLSSVGMPDLGEVNVDGFVNHPGLLQLYVDRILAVKDQTRISHPLVKQQLLTSVGVHRNLAAGLNLGELQQESGVSE